MTNDGVAQIWVFKTRISALDSRSALFSKLWPRGWMATTQPETCLVAISKTCLLVRFGMAFGFPRRNTF
jgi:hypothetical protein